MVSQSLKDAVKALADGAKDVVAALQPGQSLSQRVADFENEIGDAVTLAGEVSGIPDAVKALQPEDYGELAGILVTDLSFSSPHAQAIVPIALKVLSDTASQLVPDILALIAAVKTPPAPAASS